MLKMVVRGRTLIPIVLFLLPIVTRSQSPYRVADSLIHRFFSDSTSASDTSETGYLVFWRPHFEPGFEHANLINPEDQYSQIRYDRADGLFLGLGSDLSKRMFMENRLSGYLGFGYALGSHYWQVFGGVSKDFLTSESPFRISVEGHIRTDTKDSWKMGVIENTAYSLIAGIDTRDYFQRKGFSVTIQQFITPRVSVSGSYLYDNYSNSKREIGWSIFGPSQPFLEVPPIREGIMNSVVVNFLADYLTKRPWDRMMTAFEARAEFGLGEQSFRQYQAEVRWKQSYFDEILSFGIRGRIGIATGDAPPQKMFTIGGFGTLEGYPQNAYGGNRMVLLQTDVFLRLFPRIPLTLILSNDFGRVGTTSSTAGEFENLFGAAQEYLYSPGIYAGTPMGTLRIGFSWRTDIYAEPRLVVRFAQRF